MWSSGRRIPIPSDDLGLMHLFDIHINLKSIIQQDFPVLSSHVFKEATPRITATDAIVGLGRRS